MADENNLVGVYYGLEVPFEPSEIMDISIETDCRLPSHPIEDGTVVADTVVRSPLRATVTVILDPESYLEKYGRIKQLNTDMIPCVIQTRVETHDNMYLENYPHKEDASKFDTIEMQLVFVQQIIVQVDTSTLGSDDVADPADTSAVDRGQQLPAQSNAAVTL